MSNRTTYPMWQLPYMHRAETKTTKTESNIYKHNVRYNQYKYLGILLDTELSEDKDIQRQLR